MIFVRSGHCIDASWTIYFQSDRLFLRFSGMGFSDMEFSEFGADSFFTHWGLPRFVRRGLDRKFPDGQRWSTLYLNRVNIYPRFFCRCRKPVFNSNNREWNHAPPSIGLFPGARLCVLAQFRVVHRWRHVVLTGLKATAFLWPSSIIYRDWYRSYFFVHFEFHVKNRYFVHIFLSLVKKLAHAISSTSLQVGYFPSLIIYTAFSPLNGG